MSPQEDWCPFEARTRAARCESCVRSSGMLTPCVTNWLQARLQPAGLAALPLVEPLRKAA